MAPPPAASEVLVWGLALVKQIIDAHGSIIRVSSQLNFRHAYGIYPTGYFRKSALTE